MVISKSYLGINVNPIDKWINLVKLQHSDSPNTEKNYRHYFNNFLKSFKLTAEGISKEWDNAKDPRHFKKKYSDLLGDYACELQQRGCTRSTIAVALAVPSVCPLPCWAILK